MSKTQLVVIGLGNPGCDTQRHSAGALIVKQMAAALGIQLRTQKKLKATLGGRDKIVLAVPNVPINESGGPVARLVRAYPGARVLVLRDETSMANGAWRHRVDAHVGGHNGVKSVAGAIGPRRFESVQVGVGRPTAQVVAHVLGEMSETEMRQLHTVCQEVLEHVMQLLSEDPRDSQGG